MRSYSARLILVALVVAGFVSLLFASYLGFDRSRSNSVTSLSRNATGLSVFYSLSNKLSSGKIRQKKSAFIKDSELDGVSSVLVASPLVPVSKREAEILKRYIAKGGTVIVSFHDQIGYSALLPLLSRFDIELSMEDNPEYENGVPEGVQIVEPVSILPDRGALSVYSPVIMQGSGCSIRKQSCFFRQYKHEQGALIVMAGISPLANALIGRADNREIAYRLINLPGEILIDEYRHRFSEYSLFDLIWLPNFSIPFLALLLGGILFFIFGRSEPELHADFLDESRKVPLYHQFTQRAFRGMISRRNLIEDAVKLQVSYLTRVFPKERQRIEKIIQTKRVELTHGVELVNLHRELIMERSGGGRK